jgi:acylphosphatase
MVCAKFSVIGRVQGVFFRASAREEAVRLGLTGYARNLADGSVEVLACGEEPALAELERWLHTGPPSARVDAVRRVAAEATSMPGFRVT